MSARQQRAPWRMRAQRCGGQRRAGAWRQQWGSWQRRRHDRRPPQPRGASSKTCRPKRMRTTARRRALERARAQAVGVGPPLSSPRWRVATGTTTATRTRDGEPPSTATTEMPSTEKRRGTGCGRAEGGHLRNLCSRPGEPSRDGCCESPCVRASLSDQREVRKGVVTPIPRSPHTPPGRARGRGGSGEGRENAKKR